MLRTPDLRELLRGFLKLLSRGVKRSSKVLRARFSVEVLLFVKQIKCSVN